MSESTPPLSSRRRRPRAKDADWQTRLQMVAQMMREVSTKTDPQEMVRTYADWVQQLTPVDGIVAASRRDLLEPWYRITRSDLWEEQGMQINPWKQRDKLPMYDRGLIGKLLYAEEAHLDNDFHADPSDPAYEHLKGYRSILALPTFEDGRALNISLLMHRHPNGFDPITVPDRLWLTNLFGRATKNLVLNDELRAAYQTVERELQVVADIQRSLLPTEVPTIEGLDLAAYYQTSQLAGGDYYDFFPLDDGKLGILIADVSGHGTPAAVVMAVAHSVAHTRDDPPTPPSSLLTFINRRMAGRYTNNGTFITAFYGIYDPATRRLVYASAGHNPPRIRRGDGETISLDAGINLPLGIVGDEQYTDAEVTLERGDVLVLYTDGITEAHGATGKVHEGEDELFGTDRLDDVVTSCAPDAKAVVGRIVTAVNEFTDFAIPGDDRTLVVAKVK
ncbi:MAG: PP2C family protein-serine/threonine phosphatase [Tepidisphaeraceae bacterium]